MRDHLMLQAKYTVYQLVFVIFKFINTINVGPFTASAIFESLKDKYVHITPYKQLITNVTVF